MSRKVLAPFDSFLNRFLEFFCQQAKVKNLGCNNIPLSIITGKCHF